MKRLFENEIDLFPSSYEEIIQRIRNIDPMAYGASRNYLDGSVTYLSPYVSRGIISTKYILTAVLKRGYQPAKIEKFIQELAWRDYWQQIWIAKGDAIDSDLKHKQKPVSNTALAKAIEEGKTGILAIDEAIQNFYKTGYVHNHMRMYIASLACNLAQSHWRVPAQWMYFHLLDADWASNALSWQWVAGSNSYKKYVANQENINKYCRSRQQGTFLDVSYATLKEMPVPNELSDLVNPEFKTPLPERNSIQIEEYKATCIHNYYNLDLLWKNDISANRILLLEPSIFEKYPISPKSLDFMLSLSNNIKGIQVYVGEFNQLTSKYNLGDTYFKEHPLNRHYNGIEEPREWMFSVKGHYPSFFSFWKKCRKELYSGRLGFL